MNKIMKQALQGVFILLFVFLFKINNVNACSISVSAPSSAVVGQTFKVSVSVPSNAGSWEYVLSYDSSKVKQVSGPSKVVGVQGDSRTSTYSFTSLTSGTASFKATNASIYDYSSEKECFSGSGTASVSMKTQAEIEASYSKNNDLSSLSVEGAELTPVFNKDTLEYSATLPPDSKVANVSATLADKTASVTGIGQINVEDGLNKIEIVVTAQHGEKKTYIINLTVEELDPIEVTVNGKKYTVVRKTGIVENIPKNFSETKIKIKGQEVVAYKNELAKITLVALKDDKGSIKLFIYKNKKFEQFNEAKSSEINLLILNNSKKAPFGFTKTRFKYKKEYIKGYRLYNSKDNNYLVYAKNLETGKNDLYLYNKKDNTFSLLYEYPFEIIMCLTYIVLALSLVIIFYILTKLSKKLFTSKDNKIKKLERKLSKLKNNLTEEYYDIDDVDERPNITKIEEDEYVVPRKSRKEKLKELEEAKKRLNERKNSYKKLSMDDEEDDYDY